MSNFTFSPPDPSGTGSPKRGEPSLSSGPHLEGFRSLIETLVVSRLESIIGHIKGLDSPSAISNRDLRRAIRLREVLLVLGISKSTLYDRLNAKSASHDPTMPRPFKLGNSGRSPSVWWHHDVVGYLQSRADLPRSN